MTFRRRLILLSGVAVAAAVAVVSVITYVLVRDELRGRVDSELRSDVADNFAGPLSSLSDPPRIDVGRLKTDRGHAALAEREGTARRLFLPSGPLGGRSVYGRLIESDGQVIRPRGPRTPLGSMAAARAVAEGERDAFFTDVEVGGEHLRVFTAQINRGEAVQVARSLEETDHTLSELALILVLVSAGGVALAGVLGYFVSRAAISPVERLRRAAEQVASTRDFSRRIQAGENDELSALAESFNHMVAALDASLDTQRQLVADASHELRTPLASLRTNIDVLTHASELSVAEREALLADVDGQLDELTELVGDLVDLARDSETELEPASLVRLDLLVSAAVERAQARNPQLDFDLAAKPCWTTGVERRLERAVSNLVENAIKWSRPGGRIEVELADGELRVRDHGPGISPGDLPHVFDRFYRSTAARGMPGSGLGLAIVRQVAETHGGSVRATNAPGGGAMLVMRLPTVPAPTAVAA